MAPEKPSERAVFRVNGLWVSYAHTACASAAFISALLVGCALHFRKIVTNEFYTYPDEWFPSVSATIGDRYPERSFYQLLIALTSGPRFLMILLSYILSARPGGKLPVVMAAVGVLRTFTCGGWTYVTSTDDHDWHDIFMISYIVLTLPWMVLRTIMSKPGSRSRQYRRNTGLMFFGMIVPLVYFFIQHKVSRIAGAYSIYAFFEWALIILDIAFDAGTAYDFIDLEITVIDKNSVVAQPSLVSVLEEPLKLRESPGYIGFGVDIVNWFVWWASSSVLGLMIWYFPLWYMGVSGYEAIIFLLALPAIAIAPLRKLVARYPSLPLLGQAICAVGAYWVPAPTSRVFCVGIGAGLGSLALMIQLAQSTRQGSRSAQPRAQTAAMILGLALHATAKLYGRTNNPIWPVVSPELGLNSWGLAAALAAAAVTVTHNTNNVPSDVFDKPVATPSESWVKAGVGAGSLIFMLMTYVSDTSLLPLWVWEGYPVRGPTPVPAGLLVIVALLFGLRLGFTQRRLVLSTKALVGSSLGLAALCTLKHWPGFAGGLVVATYLGAVAPAVFEGAARHSVPKGLGLASVVYCAFCLAETWTVAYAFVPGGFALRERTWLLMALEQFLLAGAVYNARRIPSVSGSKKAAVSKTKRSISAASLLVAGVAALATFQRMQRPAPTPVHPEEKALTAGIWTVHFGFDNDMWTSEKRMADLIEDAELDVVGLLETDTQRIIGAHRDMTQGIAEELGFYADYGPGPNKHTWGAALLSRFPIVNSTHHLTPSPVGELAPAIHATLDVYGELVDVVVFHSGQEEDPEDRRLQTQYVSKILAETPRPAILLSYLVTKPLEGNYNTWVSEYTGMHDIDNTDWDRWCEYILYKGLKRTAYARISRSTITDTELQIGRFVLGEPNYSNERLDASVVPSQLRLPDKFLNEGVRNHFYHVFNEPRYYS